MNPLWLLLIVPGAMLVGALVGLTFIINKIIKDIRW